MKYANHNISQPTTMMAELPEVKLFGKWPCEDVQVKLQTIARLKITQSLPQVSDMSLQDYIAVKEKYAKYLPHSAGRLVAFQGSRFHFERGLRISW